MINLEQAVATQRQALEALDEAFERGEIHPFEYFYQYSQILGAGRMEEVLELGRRLHNDLVTQSFISHKFES